MQFGSVKAGVREYVSGFISMDLREDAIFTESENKAVGDVSLFYGLFFILNGYPGMQNMSLKALFLFLSNKKMASALTKIHWG